MIETDDYDEFMEWYENKHAFCPQCGSSEYSTTLVSFMLNFDKLDEFQDLNSCKCVDCGDTHKRHSRVEYFN